MKEIKLTQGKVALVDDEDYGFLNHWKWHLHKNIHGMYATRCATLHDGKRSQVFMHRVIMGVYDSQILIDHKDRDGLNNQRYNIRNASHMNNMYNKVSAKNSSSKYKGVSLCRSKYKDRVYLAWMAEISREGKKFYLGRFKNEDEAALAYNNAAVQLHGEFARLNVLIA